MAEAIIYIVGVIPYLLTLVFVILRAVGVIQWAWYWILSPIYIGYLITCIITLITGAAKEIWIWRLVRKNERHVKKQHPTDKG